MYINSIKNRNSVSVDFPQKEVSKNDKKKAILAVGAGVFLVGSLAALAIYNRNIVKNTVPDSLHFCKKNLLGLCKSSKPENYVYSTENYINKTFRSDLHSHSTHSDGWGYVSDILDEVAKYADKLNAETGEKFNFALTDHDRVSGVREALKIINNNPQKYKNINFIPAVELSFSFNSQNQVKSGELLAYFIDPDSKSMQILVENLNQNRRNMFKNCIEKLGNGFSLAEMEQYFINRDGETFAYNLHYRLRNYAQIKNRINKMAKATNENAEQLYKKLMDGYVYGSQVKRVPKPYVSPEGFDKYLKSMNISTTTEVIDKNINKICDEFFPKIVNGRVISNTENSFEKIIDTLKKDDGVVLAFAHPYYTAEQMTDYKNEFDKLLKYAKGKIKLSENYHQAYNPKIPKDKIEEINNYLLTKKLLPMGGRDNHGRSFWG